MEPAERGSKSVSQPSLGAIQQRARRYRLAAKLILALGFIAAGLLYWLSPREPDFSTDPSMAGFNHAERRQMGMLYGKQGQLIEDLTDSLKQPGTQAILIIVAAAIVAAGCFFFARALENPMEPTETNEPPA